MLPNEQYNLARTLQTIRNCVVHDMLPEFFLVQNNHESYLKIAGNSNIQTVIKMDREEVDKHITGKSSIEMWAYFLITRTRSLIEFLFEKRVQKLPPEF